jgi:N-methylhydantoinase A
MSGGNRLAVDIGGTFTDVVVESGSERFSTKVLTTPQAPEQGVLDGVNRILSESGITPGSIDLAIHGTTLATNALIERKGARTALVTTDGFRDSVEIAYEHRFEQYDVYMERPTPLVPRYQRHVVPERIAADGTVLRELDEDAVTALVPVLQEQDVDAVAVCLLHSYVNPDHEFRVRDILSTALPDVAITLSCEVCPEIREYERTSTACANAYVQPMMAGYLDRLRLGLQDVGVACPLLLMMSSGGVTTVETAMAFPIRLVESGPAGGAILALNIAAENNIGKALSFDMGGTTAKITMIDDYRPQLSRHFEVARMYRFLKGSGLPIRIPVIDMVEIGAGGGSIASLDELQRITVGPESAGSDPGPAAYARGGEEPTVTDADVAMGKIDPAKFAGGKVTIDPARAKEAVDRVIGAPRDMTTEIAAAGISEIVTENMANAARVHAIENGKETSDRTLIAFGGAAPLHAARLAGKLGVDRIIVPEGAGVGSAVGFLRAPIGYEVVRTRFMPLPQFDTAFVNELFRGMRAEAETVVRMGAPNETLAEVRTAFMRYRGQGHEIAVTLPTREYGPEDAAIFETAFDNEYRSLYSRVIPNLEIEILSWTLSLATDQPLPKAIDPVSEQYDADADGTRSVLDIDSGVMIEAAIFHRDDLRPGAAIPSPAIIVEDETSTFVPNGFNATVNRLNQIVITREAQPR